jgi:hypothetical protein
MKEKLNSLKVKKAMLFSQIESLSIVSDSLFLQFGKVTAEIMQIEKQLVREAINPFADED